VKTRIQRANQRGAALWRGVAGCRSGCCPSLLVLFLRIDCLEKLVVFVLDVADAVEAAGAVGAIEDCPVAAGIGDDIEAVEVLSVGERERSVEDDRLAGAWCRFGGPGATRGGIVAAACPPFLRVCVISGGQEIENGGRAVAFTRAAIF
jgi:hypothetical protein